MVDCTDFTILKHESQSKSRMQEKSLQLYDWLPDTLKKERIYSTPKITVTLQWEEADSERYPLGIVYFKIKCMGQRNQKPISIMMSTREILTLMDILHRIQTDGIKEVVAQEQTKNVVVHFVINGHETIYREYNPEGIWAFVSSNCSPQLRKRLQRAELESVAECRKKFGSSNELLLIYSYAISSINSTGNGIVASENYQLSIFHQHMVKSGEKKAEPFRLLLKKEKGESDCLKEVPNTRPKYAHVHLSENEFVDMITSMWDGYTRWQAKRTNSKTHSVNL